MQCSKFSLSVDLHQALGNLRGLIGLFGQCAVGNVIAGSARCPDGPILSSIVVGIALFTSWEGRRNVFRHRVAVCKELISCLWPRVAYARQVLKTHRGGSRLARNDDPVGQGFAVS